jgi:Methyltransferase domain
MTTARLPFNLPSRNFEPLRYGLGAWTEHIYFAYDLVAQLQPRVLVELGTDRGESYFAFCQSSSENKTATRCFAVDHWRGDTHAGTHDETTFLDVTAHNRAHYETFSTLLRCTFDEALDSFATESIDLLHIDGHHTEEAARHDVESWLPKLRSGGILLMHDVAVHGREFGVWKVWKELSGRGRNWSFNRPPGLGVWEKPPGERLPPLLEMLFDMPNHSQSWLLEYYRQRQARLQAKMARQWLDGTIRSAPMACETIIQIFWTTDGNYAEEQSSDIRIGHGGWKDVVFKLPTEVGMSGLRIDFYTPLTTIEIDRIEVQDELGRLVYGAERAGAFESIGLLGDCRRCSLDPFRIEVTGVDPQLHLPPFHPAARIRAVHMRLRVMPTAPA